MRRFQEKDESERERERKREMRIFRCIYHLKNYKNICIPYLISCQRLYAIVRLKKCKCLNCH